MAVTKTSIRESDEARRLWHEIASLHGITVSAARELVVREAAQQRGIANQRQHFMREHFKQIVRNLDATANQDRQFDDFPFDVKKEKGE